MPKTKPKILIVEDDISILDLYEYKFKTSGFDCLRATNGVQALSLTFNEKPNVVLLDIMLPKLDGLNVLKELRLSPGEVGKTPVVVLTSLTDKLFADEAMRLGANEYLVKSNILPRQVVEKVKEILKKD